MEPCTVIDLHCDTLTAFMAPTRCRDTLDDPRSAFGLSRLPRGVRWCQCCAIFIPDGLTPQESAGYYNFHLHSFQRQMARFSPCAAPCRTAGDIEEAWAAGKTSLILTVENGSALAGDLDRVEALAADGVRMITLTWNGENQLGSGSETDHGLSPFGRAAIPAMEQAGILPDVSHLNEAGFRDVLETARKPFVASHSNARAVCPHPRNLDDWQIRELTARGCLIGLNYYSPFLRADGAAADFDDLCRHTEHFLNLGAEGCLALGSDFDGADLPPCLDSCQKVPGLGQCLAERFGRETAEGIMWRSAMAFFQRNLPAPLPNVGF